jgi:hypothetical protein
MASTSTLPNREHLPTGEENQPRRTNKHQVLKKQKLMKKITISLENEI